MESQVGRAFHTTLKQTNKNVINNYNTDKYSIELQQKHCFGTVSEILR